MTLRIFAIAARPPVSLPTTLFLCATQLGADRPAGSPKLDAERRRSAPTSSITAATCSSAFDGMQPTFRQTPPSVAIALDQHGLHAEVGGAERGRVAARAGAEHEHVALEVGAAGVGAGAAQARAVRGLRRGGPAPQRGRLRGAACGAGAAPRAGAAAAARLASSVRITEPSLTVSPTLTFSSLTTPACDDGISIDALSLSTVIRLCSTLTVSPGLTSTSMTATSLKSPMSGHLDFDQCSRAATALAAQRATPRGSRRGLWAEVGVEARRRGAVDRRGGPSSATAAASGAAGTPCRPTPASSCCLADAEDRDLGRVDDRREVACRRCRRATRSRSSRRSCRPARACRRAPSSPARPSPARSAARPSCRRP